MSQERAAGPELSVIVCSHNGERRLGRALSLLQRQSLSRSRYEVIVVDDGSSDRTAEIGRSSGARVVRLKAHSGLAAARNAGLRAAQGSLVAFTDDDCEPAESWLAALTKPFSDARVDGVGGRLVPACSNLLLLRYLQERNPLSPLPAELLAGAEPAYRLRLYVRNVLGSRPALPDGAPLYAPVGANMAFRRDLIVRLGGFDEAFTRAGEEEELCRRGHKQDGGLHLRYEPRAVVVHRFGPRLGDSLRRARAYGRAYSRAREKDPQLRPIVYPFPMLAAFALVAALLARRRLPLALTLLAPTAAYGRWPRYAWRIRSVAPLAFAYLELCEEASTMIGELERHRGGHRP